MNPELISRIKRKLEDFNPALESARKTQEFLQTLGATSRIIGNGNSRPCLEKVLSQSLLGCQIKIKVEEEVLTSYERSLIDQNPQILSIVDWDGIMGSPLHALTKFSSSPCLWSKGLEGLKKAGNISRQEWAWFKNMIYASSHLVVWSSRLTPDENFILRFLAKPFSGSIDYFPFLDDSSKARMVGKRQNKVEVWAQKPLFRRKQTMEQIVNCGTKKDWDMIYYVGSSLLDRKAAREFVAQNPLLSYRFCFFDTGHLVL